MRIGDWREIVEQMPADTPVIFCSTVEKPLQEGDYCDGLRVSASRMWLGCPEGWSPCVLVELGEAF